MVSAKQTHAGAKATNPFVERSDVNAPSAHMTIPLDEQLQLITQQEEKRPVLVTDLRGAEKSS